MSANDEIKCPECGTVATEKTWQIHDGQCLNCGHHIPNVWKPYEVKEPVQETPSNVTYSGVFTDVSAKPTRQNSSPVVRDMNEYQDDQLTPRQRFPYKKLIILVLCVMIAIPLFLWVDTLVTKGVVSETPVTVTDVASLSTYIPDATQLPTDMPTIVIKGLPAVQQSDTVVLTYLFSEDEAANKVKRVLGLILLVALNLLGFLDRKRSHQNSDAVIAVLVTVLYLIMGMSVFQQVLIQMHPMWAVWVLGLLAATLFGLLIGAMVSGAFDLTPATMVFGSLAIIGGYFFNNIGAFQTLFKISSDLMYTYSSLVKLAKIHMLKAMGSFAMLVDGHFTVALLCGFIEIVRPTKKGIKIRIQNFYGFFLSLVIVGIFILMRSITIPSGQWYSFLQSPIALAIFILLCDFAFANLFREQLDGYGVSYTEYVLGNQQIAAPYDLIIFQVVLGAFLLALIGTL